MRFTDLTRGYDVRNAPADDIEITGITEDSRRVSPGMLFVAVRGTADDGTRYVTDALRRGAAAVAGEFDDAPPAVPFVRTTSARRALAEMAARFYGQPGSELKVIGFTGTFGKTSTSAILEALLSAGGVRTGVLGSLGARFAAFRDAGTGLTTPAPVELQRTLRALKDAGADAVIMEVTSHALRLGRVDGLRFGGGLLAAIMPGEHTDFHRSYEDYIDAKRLFLNYLAPDAVLAYDADNHAARTLAAEARVATRAGFSLHGRESEVAIRNIALDHRGARFTTSGRRLDTPLLGRGHLKNVALAVTYALTVGIPLDVVRPVLRGLQPLPRRMERYVVARRQVLDDTAGHPDSLHATFDVAAMLGRAPAMRDARTVVVYAIRGNRGVDINRRNARALTDLVSEHGAASLIVTGSMDVAGPNDRASAEEIDATREAFAARGRSVAWCDALSDAAGAAMESTREGDLIVLVGAQGMNEGRALLEAAAS